MSAKTPFEALAKLKAMPDVDDLTGSGREWVYFLRAEAQALVKIGKSEKLKWRLLCLAHGSPVALRLVGALNCPKGAERLFHIAFSADRQHGEWFAWSERLCRFIETMPKGEAVLLPAFVKMMADLGVDTLNSVKLKSVELYPRHRLK